MSVAQTCRHVVETTPFIPAPRTPAFLVHHSPTCALPLPRPLTIVGRFVWTHGTFPKTPAPFHALFHLLWPAPSASPRASWMPGPVGRVFCRGPSSLEIIVESLYLLGLFNHRNPVDPGSRDSSAPCHPFQPANAANASYAAGPFVVVIVSRASPSPPSTEAPSPRTTKATSPPRPRPLSPDDQVPLSAGRISPSESHNGTAAPLHIRTYARRLPKTRTDLSTWVDATLAAPCPTYPFPNQPTTDSASLASPPSALCFGLPALASWFSERRDTCTETTKQIPPGPARPLLSTCYLEP